MTSALEPRAAAALGGIALTLGLPAPVSACTTCNSDTADAVRARLLDGDLVANAAAVLAPVPLLAAALLLVGAAARAAHRRRDGHG